MRNIFQLKFLICVIDSELCCVHLVLGNTSNVNSQDPTREHDFITW